MSDDDKETTPPVPPKDDDNPTPPPTPPTPPTPQNDDGLRETVSALSEKVEELSGMVTGLLAAGGGPKDEPPTRVPWTHRGGKRR